MIFNRAVQRYGRTPEPVTPFHRAGQLWDERIGSARTQARSWRLMAFGALGLTAVMSGAVVWQSLQSRVTPYVVEIDRLGEARAITEAAASYRPTDPQVAWHLAKFVENVRSVSLDPVLMRRNWLTAYDFVTKRGATALGDYARSTNPFGALGEKTVSVQVTSVVRASDQSFQIKWIETAYDRGAQTGASHWTGILSIKLVPPVDADTIRKNPLGVYVDAIDWSRELEPPSAAPTAPAKMPPLPATDPTMPSGAPLDPTLGVRPAPAFSETQK